MISGVGDRCDSIHQSDCFFIHIVLMLVMCNAA